MDEGRTYMNKIKCAAVLLLIIAAMLAGISSAAAKENDKQGGASLRGLKGVGVVVEDLAPDTVQEGFNTQLLQADVEQKLRAAGIKILTEQGLMKATGMPYIYLNIFTFKDDELYAYHITLELKQMVSLVRKPGISLSSSTWKACAGGTVGVKKISELRPFIADAADQFVSSWKAANP
jgi:hypothetical protein